MCNNFKLLFVVSHTAARAAERICRTYDNRVAAYPLRYFKTLFNSIGYVGRNDRLVYLLHGLFKELPVFRPVYRTQIYAYKLYAPLVQKALFCELAAEREAGLSAEGGKKAVRPFLDYYSL